VAAQEIRSNARYKCVRVRCVAMLGNARVPIQVDIGYGDVITPSAALLEYPTFLDLPAPRLCGYPPETVIAERFEAMVSLDLANTRMKDFPDIWVLLSNHSFEGAVLRDALVATFARRATPWPSSSPTALTSVFYDDAGKQKQWSAYLKKSVRAAEPLLLPVVVAEIRGFLMPVVAAIREGTDFRQRWAPAGPWMTRDD
jgi:hypothetical protein